jgi:ABC-type transport system substrate-binding protein
MNRDRGPRRCFVSALSLVGVVCFALVPEASAAAIAPHAVSDPNGILKIGTDLSTSFSTPFSADPAQDNGSPIARQWMNLVYDNLIRFTPDGKPTPGLAKSWKITNDHTLELSLRSGVSF